jgi:hypothetical protein
MSRILNTGCNDTVLLERKESDSQVVFFESVLQELAFTVKRKPRNVDKIIPSHFYEPDHHCGVLLSQLLPAPEPFAVLLCNFILPMQQQNRHQKNVVAKIQL